MVYPAAWVRIPLAPPVAGSLPDDLRGWGIPQPEMKMLSGVLVPLGSPTWNISTDGQCLQLITEITKVQIFYVPPALRTCRKGLKPFLVIYRSKKNHRSVWQHRSRTNLPPNHPAGKTVLQHRTPVISERLSRSAGFCDRQSFQLRWDDFFLWCFASHGVSYSRQSPWYLQAPPLRPAPHTASRSYPED